MRKKRVFSWLLVGILACSLAITLSLGTANSVQAQALATTNSALTLSGGLNLQAYCQSQGFGPATTVNNTYYGWRCILGTGYVTFSMQAACQWQYQRNDMWDTTPNFYSPTGGQCWQGQNLGGINLRAYCQSHGFNDVTLLGSTVYDWYCTLGTGYVTVNWDNACSWMYNRSAKFRFADFYTATSGQCIG